jgi:transposase
MPFVALKTEERQARSMIFRTRGLLVRQRTQLVNALRGHLAEHGIVAAHGLCVPRPCGDAANAISRALNQIAG